MTAPPVAMGPDAALTRAFDRVRALPAGPAQDVDAAERALAQVLQPVSRSPWPEVAWRSGVLTATGYPVELAWASRDLAVRWTCEVAGPETAEADRLRLAGRAAAELTGPVAAGGPASRPGLFDLAPWAGVQHGARLRWGAWLGLRQLADGRRTKVYLELPQGRPAPGPWSAAAAELAARTLDLGWRMAGVNDDGSLELYARLPEPTWTELGAAAALVGDQDRLRQLVTELVGRPGRGAAVLPRRCGLSLVLDASGAPAALTWFGIAKAVWPDDDAVRAGVQRALAGVEHPAGAGDLYRALSGGPADGRWRHGMVGVGVDRAGGGWLQAGLRPT